MKVWIGDRFKKKFAAVPNHGRCAVCGKDVFHHYPWFTRNPKESDAKPVHDECFRPEDYRLDGLSLTTVIKK